MAKQQTPAPPLIKEKKIPITKPELKFKRTNPLEQIATTIDSSFTNLRTKRAGVSVYIRPTSVNISELLESGTDKQDYRFEKINSEELRKKFLEATTHIKPLTYSSLGSEAHIVHIYLYSIENKRRIYNITKILYTNHIS